MEMNFTDHEFERYALRPHDILLNEGQSLELIGRPAMYRGEVAGACFTNTLVRFRANVGVNPDYALAVFSDLPEERTLPEDRQDHDQHCSSWCWAICRLGVPLAADSRAGGHSDAVAGKTLHPRGMRG